MITNKARLDCPGAIDRNRTLRFTFDGKKYCGYQGDTLASALIANDVNVVARSFKLHRPRGVLSAGVEECNAIVQVGEGAGREVNARATQVLLYDGLVAESQNCWPSAQFDISAIYSLFSRFLPAGFYLKTFMWPHWHWYEGFIRRAAGLGRVNDEADPDYYTKRFCNCDVLVVGGGPAGITAALSAAHVGASVMLLDDQTQLGGTLLWENESIDGQDAKEWLSLSLTHLDSLDNVQVLPHTVAVGYYDHNFVTAVQTLGVHHCAGVPSNGPRQRLLKIRAAQVVLATGAIERPMVFPDNDRPGILLASAVRHYANRYAVSPGKSVALFTNNDFAYRTALDLVAHGVAVCAIIDIRPVHKSVMISRARELGIRLLSGYGVIATTGHKRLKRVQVAPLNDTGTAFVPGAHHWIDCDTLAMSGGWNPVVHLYSQAGGKLKFDNEFASFVPDQCEQRVTSVGAVNGSYTLNQCLTEGHKKGSAVAIAAGFLSPMVFPDAPYSQDDSDSQLQPYWQTPAIDGNSSADSQWVDFLHDVTVADINLSAKEGFHSVEHLKRYTATGMAVDQGKTSNINALAVMGQATQREVGQVGTTRFRPPYLPVTIGTLAGSRVGELSNRYRRLPVVWHWHNNGIAEDHSGWLRPAYYAREGETEEQSITREAMAARQAVALFDSSSLGKIEVQGTDAAEFLNRVYINNVKTLQVGKVRYGMMLNDNGSIIDDGVFARLGHDHFLVTTSSEGALTIAAWMEQRLQCDWCDLEVFITPVTAQWATLTLSGPRSRRVLEKLGLGVDLSTDHFPHMSVASTELEGISLRVFRVSFTGEISYELNIPADYADSLWQLLLKKGKSEGITPLGMEALNILRIEKGFLEVGVETSVETTPLDVGWSAPISLKSEDFIGRRSLVRSHNQRADRLQLVGLHPQDKALQIPEGTLVLNEHRERVGHVTSSCNSVSLNTSICMAMVQAGESLIGRTLVLAIGPVDHPAEVSSSAFYDPKGDLLNV
jgi:sarcosine oxidase subunit alpha|tara:strand:+ start:9162 stop:12158 length:2997 start_codon:yes stop_codon:yes gene_type:complete